MRRKKKASPTDPGKSLPTVQMGTDVVFPRSGKDQWDWMEHTVRNPELAPLPHSCDLPSKINKTSNYYEIIQLCTTTDIVRWMRIFIVCGSENRKTGYASWMPGNITLSVLDNSVAFADCSNCGNVLADSQPCLTSYGASSFHRGQDGWDRTGWGSSTEVGVFPLSEPVLLCGFLLHEMCH